MNSRTRERLIHITEKLGSNPITSLYRTTPTGGKQLPIIMSYQTQNEVPDLEGVLRLLKTNHYTTTEQWENDVSKILSKNTRNIEDKNKAVQIEANMFVLKKILKNNANYSVNSWSRRIVQIKKRIGEVQSNPPSTITEIAPQLSNYAANSNLKIWTQNEINCFLKASELLYSEKHHAEFIKIIGAEESELELKGSNFIFDTTKLKLTTLYKLREYMECALKKEGKSYPVT